MPSLVMLSEYIPSSHVPRSRCQYGHNERFSTLIHIAGTGRPMGSFILQADIRTMCNLHAKKRNRMLHQVRNLYFIKRTIKETTVYEEYFLFK